MTVLTGTQNSQTHTGDNIGNSLVEGKRFLERGEVGSRMQEWPVKDAKH